MRSSFFQRKKTNNCGFAKKLLVTAAFCLFVLPSSIFSKTLAEYRASLDSAAHSVEKLVEYNNGMIHEGGKTDSNFERETIAAIRQTLPVTEKIEWQGNSVDADNQWLEANLKAFEASAGNASNRRLILTDTGERLDALAEKITQLENPAAASRSKDEDKRKLAEILRRDEYRKKQPDEESWFQKVMRKIREWFRQKFPQPDIPEGTAQGLQTVSYGMQMLLYAVLFGFIAFLIYRFAPFFAKKFRRRAKEDQSERVILGEKLSANEDAQTLFDEAETLARNGNLRGAIRKGYIALLCELSDRKIIGLAQHKTNRDYLRDVRKKRELHQNMNGLTNSFERHWYGFDDVDENDWNEFKQTYQKTISS